jgi:hypothetical protein
MVQIAGRIREYGLVSHIHSAIQALAVRATTRS